MAQLNDTMVQGDLRVTGTVYGNLTGNAATATSAGKLTTARKTYVTLGTASTTTTRDWSGDTTIPVSGTLAISNGGTGATQVTGSSGALHNLTNDQIGTASQWFLTITNSWQRCGYCSVDDAKTVLGLGSAAYLNTGTTSGTVALGNHAHGNIASGGTLSDTAAAAAGNDYVVIRDADNAKIQTSTIKGTDVADAVSKKHSHSTLTLSTTAQAYDGSHTLALPSTDPYTSARTPSSHTHGNIANGGTLQTNDITIASGDKLVVTDSDNSHKVARTSLSFDGSTTTKALTQKGTFETFLTSHQDISGKVDYAYVSDPSVIDSNSTADSCKTYFVNNVSPGRCKIVYNKNGDEYTLIFSRQHSGTYGNIIKYGYANNTIYMLRYKNTKWESTDWEVISAGSVNATTGNSITSTGSNGSMEILNGALSSASGGGGSCSIDGDGISFTQGVSGTSMTAASIATSGTGTFTEGASAKGRPIDGSATIVTNSSLTWNAATAHLVVNRSAASTTTIDLKSLNNSVVYWLHVPRDNIIALKNSSAISTFYCYNAAFTTTKTTDTYNIRSHIKGGEHGGFSVAIVRSSTNFYVMMDY